MKGKVWQQRLSKPLHPAIHALNRSLDYDRRLWPYDLQVSRVWVQALERAGVLSAGELLAISGGLESIREELAAGKFAFSDDDEDIHMAIERRLEELIGSAANKLHTGRSRNDQVATDLRLFCRESGEQVSAALRGVIAVLVDIAEAQAAQPFPGHTHLQQAEVLSLGHILLAHATALRSDAELLERTAAEAMAACPLGAGALGGALSLLPAKPLASYSAAKRLTKNPKKRRPSRLSRKGRRNPPSIVPLTGLPFLMAWLSTRVATAHENQLKLQWRSSVANR
ncbi:MAG: hypothetical protein IIC41_06400, partial [Candidatus Marinimicrobia bacterium]|nr:hypothetical protein [Candidatus Neomarinimicrobiota bacterium]